MRPRTCSGAESNRMRDSSGPMALTISVLLKIWKPWGTAKRKRSAGWVKARPRMKPFWGSPP